MNIFRISPIIRITLFCLYVALTIPLPFLAASTQAPIPPSWLWGALVIGAIALYGALSQQVILDEEKIAVTYPRWVPKLFYRGWELSWDRIDRLQMRTTGQGGLVYYFVTKQADRAYLLPMRIAGFTKMLSIVEAKTGIDTTDIYPLSQPWMYIILFICTLFLLSIDMLVISH
jgi:hypothetical protein